MFLIKYYKTKLNRVTEDFTRPTLILSENEGAGLSEEFFNLADLQVQIPLARSAESLNIATALFLYEARRQTTRS